MDKKIIDYNIIQNYRSVDISAFLDEIEEAIRDGYQPYGDPCLEFDYRAQVMVKYEE